MNNKAEVSVKRLNSDILMTASHFPAWPKKLDICEIDPEQESYWLQFKLEDICSLAMPRAMEREG